MGTLRMLNGEFDTETLNPPTQARYPCLKNFWKMQDVADNPAGASFGDLSTIVDSIGGNDLTNSLAGSNIYFTAGDGNKIATMGGAAQVTQAFSFEDKHTVLMWLATREAGFDMGVGPALINTAGGTRFNDGTNAANTETGNISTGTDEMAILSLDISKTDATGISLAKVDASGYTPVTLVKGGISSDVDLSLYTGTSFAEDASVDNTYGIAVFQFTDMPSANDLATAGLWMRERWLANEKVIFPGWLNRD